MVSYPVDHLRYSFKKVIKNCPRSSNSTIKLKIKNQYRITMLRCTLCRKTFLKCNIFIFHLKVQHPLQQNYLCGYQYCLRKFSNVFSLKKHMNSSNHLVVASNHIKTRNVCVDSDLSNRSNVSQNDKDDNAAISDFDEINTKDIPVQLTDTDLTRCLLKFIGSLYCNPSITRNPGDNLT
jgi:hypothetical protein